MFYGQHSSPVLTRLKETYSLKRALPDLNSIVLLFPARNAGRPVSAWCDGHVRGSGLPTGLPLYQREVRSTLVLQRHSIEFLRKKILEAQ